MVGVPLGPCWKWGQTPATRSSGRGVLETSWSLRSLGSRRACYFGSRYALHIGREDFCGVRVGASAHSDGDLISPSHGISTGRASGGLRDPPDFSGYTGGGKRLLPGSRDRAVPGLPKIADLAGGLRPSRLPSPHQNASVCLFISREPAAGVREAGGGFIL